MHNDTYMSKYIGTAVSPAHFYPTLNEFDESSVYLGPELKQ